MPYPTLVDELAALHREPIGLIDELLMATSDADDNVNHKNGGGGHLDLMCARLLHRHCQDV